MTRLPDATSLQLLVDVSATGSISAAARRAGISQAAASKRLGLLERRLGVGLLARTTAGTDLTSEGRVVIDRAARVLSELHSLLDATDAMRAPASADLRLAASLTVAEHLVPAWLSALRRAEPDLHVHLSVTNSAEVQRLVGAGEVDLGLVETTRVDDGLQSRTVAHDRLTVVVAPDHPWADRRRPLAIRELAAAQLIVREPGSGTRETLDRLLAPFEPTPPLLELGSNAAVRGAVRAGVGPAVLSRLAVADELGAGRLAEVAVTGADLSRPLTAVWHGDRALSAPAAALLRLARAG